MASRARSDSSVRDFGLVALLAVLTLGAIIWAAIGIQASILDDRIDRFLERQGTQDSAVQADLAAAGGAFPDQAQALPVAISDQAKAQSFAADLPPASVAPVKAIVLEATDNAVFGIAKDVNFTGWTFGGTVPAQPLRVRQGDTVTFTLVNKGTLGHSMDFHAAAINPGRAFRTVLPGESYSFEWVAENPGVFMFHCGTAPVIEHIGNGMYGAIIVDPATPLPPAREFALVQSEFSLGEVRDGAHVGNLQAMLADRPDYVVFNGMVNQYIEHPLQADPGELIRLWVVNAGPTRTSAFHVIGAVFSAVYVDGNPANKLTGVSTYTIPAGGAAMFELAMAEEGTYPFVTHSFADASRGAIGVIRVGNPPQADAESHAGEDHAAAAVKLDVSMTDNKFAPSQLELKAGEATTITAANKGQALHNLRIVGLQGASGKDAQTALLQGGQSGSVTLTAEQPGSYKFVCDVHPVEMTGTLTVR